MVCCSLNSALFSNGSVLKGQCNQITHKDFLTESQCHQWEQIVRVLLPQILGYQLSGLHIVELKETLLVAHSSIQEQLLVFKKNSVPITPKSTDLSVNLHQKGLFLQQKVVEMQVIPSKCDTATRPGCSNGIFLNTERHKQNSFCFNLCWKWRQDSQRQMSKFGKITAAQSARSIQMKEKMSVFVFWVN